MSDAILIISYYDLHPISNLINLFESMKKYKSGYDFDLCVVINKTSKGISDELINLSSIYSFKLFGRPNLGMNIGAWDFGWRYNAQYKYVLFLQDECYIKSDNWLIEFINCEEKNPGLIGESYNTKWNISWVQVINSNMNIRMPGHFPSFMNRALIYKRHILQRGTIVPSNFGHLRSLIWFCKIETLFKIDGFNNGLNFGECISSEIEVSFKVLNLGLKVAQINSQPFKYIGHSEWANNEKIINNE
jgi:hypothetical protein